MVYIRQDKLPKLREYKYSGVDHSLLSQYVLKPFYSHVVIKCFPMWMAPNLITLSGFGFIIVNFLTLLWYTPTLDQDCPPWVYASWAIGLFLYQTFDAVDGSQARRTRQSGPLGELFDHGVDAINTTLEVLLFSATMNLGQGWKTVLTLFALYASTAYLGGGSFWQRSMIQSLGVKEQGFIPEVLYNLAWNEWYMVYGGVVLVFNTVSSAQNVMKARRARGQKARVALLGLLTFGAAWVLITAYLYLQPMILHHHLVPFIFYAGLINAYSVGRMIISHLTKSRFPRGNVLMYPLIYGVIDSLGPWLQEHIGVGWPSALGNDVYQVAFVFMCLGLAVGVHGSFIVDVIWTICDYLDIWCLTIKYPYQPVKENIERKGQ
ncbi:hypothetical protein J4E86_009139 [Alternaria arbusti]|uniref:uncharacterized protein n=1 Tax=Alternaria arbusti TaxID=232088 RepID=UPI00221F8E32|nr:uncharacterized protein J4E86_009139 [Alternaria arbusti]KAI4945253.1 hypothetical protein J4E86_009139 [Alternaria arbusti]